MKLNNLVFLIITTFLCNSFPSLLQAANQESVKMLDTLLPRNSIEQTSPLDLSGLDMRSRNLCASEKNEKINFKNVNFENANFAGKEICNANFEGANIKNANFEGASITSCNFTFVKGPANFTKAKIKYTGFNNAKLENSLFISSDIESTGFDYAELQNSNFNNSVLVAVNFYSADLTGWSRDNVSMDRTNFQRSKGTSWFD